MLKEKIANFLDNKIVNCLLITLILLNLIVFILQTDVIINKKFSNYFVKFEIFSVILFTIEYILRIFCIKTVKEIFGFFMLIDLLAILPFYLSCIAVNTVAIRALRLFRVFRIFKITRYTKALNNIKNAFIKRKNELIITGIIFITAVLISSILIYYAEHTKGQEVFRSIGTSFWWAIVTFTTVGYGDTYPVTTLGKFVGSLTAIFGVGLHGLLIGVISSALAEVINGENNV